MPESLSGELTVTSEFSRIEEARAWVAVRAAKIGFDEVERHDLELALTEALSNIIRHSYGGAPGNPIRISLAIEGDCLRMELADVGKPFSEASYLRPDLDTPSDRGYGVFLMEQLMDEVRRERSGEENILVLVKRRNDG